MLTARQREALAHLAIGLTVEQTARAMRVSPHTANRHRAEIYSRLGVRNRSQLTLAAIRLGVI